MLYLEFDSDLYLSVVDGCIVWIVDGYIISLIYLYLMSVSFLDVIVDLNILLLMFVIDDINYICNLVKVMVDVYDGFVMFYVWDDEDLVLKIW